MKIELTKQDTPSRPVLIESDYVARTTPLRRVMPSQNSQTPGAVEVQYTGTRLDFADGSYVNVTEDYQSVKDLFADKQELDQLPLGQLPDFDPDKVREDISTALTADYDRLVGKWTSSDLPVEDDYVKAEGTIEIHDVEPPEGTPLTEEELKAVAEHEAIPDDERSPQPGELSPAEKRKATLEAKKKAAKSDDEA